MGNLVDRDLYVAQEGLLPRDGGPYLDQEERLQAEVLRAKKEGRKPETDLAKVPATAGTQLTTYDRLSDGHASNPSQRERLDTPSERKDFEPPVHQTVKVDDRSDASVEFSGTTEARAAAEQEKAKKVEPKDEPKK